MLNIYMPRIAVALGGVAPKLNPNQAVALKAVSLPRRPAQGLGWGDIGTVSERATAANGLQVQRPPQQAVRRR